MDTSHIEAAGRDWLVRQLLDAGFEVAYPDRDRDVDLIVSATAETGRRSVACVMQMKASAGRTFTVHRKYETRPDLLHVFVWNVMEPSRTVAYALTFAEAVGVAEAMGWTKTDSWLTGARTGKPGYGTTHPGERLVGLLERFRMGPEKWRAKVINFARTATTEPAL